jgi:D-2-hydroxyacid dehydrogenase (NADP+)
MKVLVFLNTETQAFCLSTEQLQILKENFPAWNFCQVFNEEDTESNLIDTDIFVTWFFPKEWYEKAPCLRAICTPSAGKEYIHHDPVRKIPVFHGAFHGPLMAESLLSMILFFNRRMSQSLYNKEHRIWNPQYLCNTTMLGAQHVVIVGYGSIGRACASIIKPFGTRITGIRRSAYDPVKDRDADLVTGPEQLLDFLSHADHVVSILPGGHDTDRFFTKDHFSSMKPQSYFYNLGRGNSYLESDIVDALRDGKIAGAGLDVFNREPLDPASPLWELPNVFIMPHGSAVTKEYMLLFVNELVERLRVFS